MDAGKVARPSNDEVERLVAERHHDLLEELHRFRRVFDSVSNGITIADATLPEHPLTYVNPAFERMTGYTAAEACGRNCRFLQGAERDQPGVAAVREAIHAGREVRVVLRNYRKDGTLFWNELYMSPIADLEGRVTHFAGIQNDVTVQMESARKMEYLAHHDALTGLANRAQMMTQLRHTLSRARRSGTPVAVLFFDLNNFKQVNDVLGHEAGDRLLQTVAARMRELVREGETLARLGGDEFVVVLEDFSDERQPVQVMQRLIDCLSESTNVLGDPFQPSASVGMALFPEDGDSAESLLKAADFRMYVAKHSARSKDESEEGLVPAAQSEGGLHTGS
jgi:diguanylate cyclase (GGDEF)-like protein/PAS domain S-box-containing protein